MANALRGLLVLTRPGNVVAAAILATTGVYVAGGLTLATAPAVAIGATALGTAAGNAINDYFDREIDAINRPHRPIPAGQVSPPTAKWFAAVCLAIAVVLTVAFLPIESIAIAAINLVLLVAYTKVFKGLPGFGNAVVGFLVASALWFGGASVGDLLATFEIGVLAGVATFAREVLKDIEDMPGDHAEGLRTLPLVLGHKQAWYVAAVALVIGAALSPIPYLQGTFGWWYLVGLIPALGVMGHGWFRGLVEPAVGQRWLKVGMYIALLAFIIGRLQLQL